MNANQTRPLISILIPLYNHEQFIEQTLESIIADSYPNKELIVLDDGSKDASFQRASQWRDQHGHRFSGRFEVRTRENRGVSATLNELFSLSRGRYIAYVSSDDYLLPGGVAARLEYLEQNPHRMLVVGDYITVDYDGKICNRSGIEEFFKGSRRRLRNEKLLSYEIIFNWCLAGPIYMGRRELYEKTGGYNEDMAVEDWDFCLRLLPDEWLGYVDYSVAAYRLRPDELTHAISVQQHIRYNEAMLQTVTNSIPRFTGLKRYFLYASKLVYSGVLERFKGNDSLRAFMSRKAGRILVSLLKAVYRIWARLVLTTSPKQV
ncbi:MAG: glycosyltransferase [Desulfuromonadales bacterium]